MAMQLESTIVPLDRRRFADKEDTVPLVDAKTTDFDPDERQERLRARFQAVVRNGTLLS